MSSKFCLVAVSLCFTLSISSLSFSEETLTDAAAETASAEQTIKFNFAKAGFENYRRKKKIAMAKPVYNGVLTPFVCESAEDAMSVIKDLTTYGELPDITMKSIAYGIRDEMRDSAKKLHDEGKCTLQDDALTLLSQSFIIKSTHFDESYVIIRNWQSKKIFYLPAVRRNGIVFTIQMFAPAEVPEREFSKRRTPCPKSVKCKKLNDGL